jgi:hypothetical protein
MLGFQDYFDLSAIAESISASVEAALHDGHTEISLNLRLSDFPMLSPLFENDSARAISEEDRNALLMVYAVSLCCDSASPFGAYAPNRQLRQGEARHRLAPNSLFFNVASTVKTQLMQALTRTRFGYDDASMQLLSNYCQTLQDHAKDTLDMFMLSRRHNHFLTAAALDCVMTLAAARVSIEVGAIDNLASVTGKHSGIAQTAVKSWAHIVGKPL